MKTVIKMFVVIFIMSFCTCTQAQTKSTDDILSEGKAMSKKAYLSYNKDLFLKARSIFEDVYKKDTSSLLPLYYLTLVDYKLIEIGSIKGEQDLFDKYYESAIKNAELLSNDKNFNADGKILLAGIYMMKIAGSPMSAITLSPKIHSLLDEAQKINPQKSYSYVIRGIMKFNTPAMFGGSYEDALKNFNLAIKLFDNKENTDTTTPEWCYVEALAWSGRALEKLENYEAAQFTYKKALDSEPEYGWVKYSLLPKLNETLSKK